MRDLRTPFAPLSDLDEIQGRILDRILHGPIAWQTVAQLGIAAGLDLEAITDAVADLDAGGWIDAWDREPDPVVTLSVAGAARLGARIVERGPSRTPCWALAGDPEPPEPPAVNVAYDEHAGGLAMLPDPEPGPELLAILHEEQEIAARSGRSRRLRADVLPLPTILLGTSLTPWPGPLAFRHGCCPACRSRPLRHSMYCLGCDRWGLEHLVVEEPDELRLIEKSSDVESLRRDHERRASKRRERFQSQSECCRRKRGRRSSSKL